MMRKGFAWIYLFMLALPPVLSAEGHPHAARGEASERVRESFEVR